MNVLASLPFSGLLKLLFSHLIVSVVNLYILRKCSFLEYFSRRCKYDMIVISGDYNHQYDHGKAGFSNTP